MAQSLTPGTSLHGKPENMKVAELKGWLSSRGMPTKGKKADLVARYIDIVIFNMKLQVKISFTYTG